MTLTDAEKKAQERARKRALGLRPLEVWARPEHHQAIRDLARELAEQGKNDASRDNPNQ